MRKALQSIDALLNRFTMYKVVLYGLMTFLALADVLAWTGAISIGPLGLLISIVVLGLVCYVSNELLGKLFHAPTNSESYLISAMILACILPTPSTLTELLYVALAGVLAMVSKYVLVFRGSHFLNPVAIAAFVMSVTGLLPAIWWPATPVLLPFTSLLALAVLRKQRNFTLALTFGITAGIMLIFVGTILHGLALPEVVKGAIGSWPIIFMGSIMLTEPSTLPPTRYYQVLFAVLVGVVFSSQLHVGSVSATPQVALLIGNVFTLLFVPAMGALVRLKKISQLAPNLYDFAFEKPKGMNFTPGQYLEWTLPYTGADIRGNRRMFSIASAPSEPELHIGIKTYEPSSSFKRALLKLQPGKYIRVAHVAGNFTLPAQTDKPLVFIAGGIGITPFRSMIKHLADTRQRRDVTLLYVASSETDFVYRQDFTAAEKVGVKTQYVVGRLKPDTFKADLPRLNQSLIYISGPDAMVSGYVTMLVQLGVPRMSIKTDHFTGY